MHVNEHHKPTNVRVVNGRMMRALIPHRLLPLLAPPHTLRLAIRPSLPLPVVHVADPPTPL